MNLNDLMPDTGHKEGWRLKARRIYESLVLLCAFTSPAWGCWCGPLSMEQYFAKADGIFTGTVVDAEMKPCGVNGRTCEIITFSVSESWKGPDGPLVHLLDPSIGCSMQFERGHSYLVVAHLRDGRLDAGGCSHQKFPINAETTKVLSNHSTARHRLIGQLLDPESEVRAEARAALTSLPTKEGEATLKALLGRVYSLQEGQSAAGHEALQLVKTMKVKDRELRHILRQLMASDLHGLRVHSFQRMKDFAPEELVSSLESPAAGTAVSFVTSSNRDARYRAYEILWSSATREAVSQLAAIVSSDADAEAKTLAAGLIYRLVIEREMQDEKILGLIVPLLDSSNVLVRKQILSTLKYWKNPSAVQPSLKRIAENDSDKPLRIEAIESIDPAQAKRFLNDRDLDVRAVAAERIASFDGALARRMVLQLLDHPDTRQKLLKQDDDGYFRVSTLLTTLAIVGKPEDTALLRSLPPEHAFRAAGIEETIRAIHARTERP